MRRQLGIRDLTRAFVALVLGSAGFLPLLPIPLARAASPVAGRTIVLNPEEGGSQPGGIAGGVEEKDINLPTTLDVGTLLRQQGARVIYTRSTDITVSLQARAALANHVHADAFITIAANTLNDPNFSGVTTFYGKSGGYVGGQARSANLVATSRDLAQDVQNGVLQATGEVNRGVQSADFYVLGYAQMPAILIETGFMTNPAELRQLVAPGYQEIIAEGIVSGIEQFFSGLGSAPAATTAAADGSYVSDVTYPDHSAVAPGQTITKTWQVANSGATGWDSTYSLVLQPGSTVLAAASSPLPAVPAGQTAELSVPVTVPSAPGTYSGIWRLTAPDGQTFGDPLSITVEAGAAFNPFWVETTQQTALWSAADAQRTVVAALGQWTYLQVTGPQIGSRLPVTGPQADQHGFVAASAVGPSGAPPPGYSPPPVQPPFQPFWVETTQATSLYSGPGDPSVTFGTIPQWAPLLVLAPQQSTRFYVRNPTTGGTAYVNAAVVGPSGPPNTTAPSADTVTAAALSPATPTSAYVVKAGDTIFSISRFFKVNVAAIVQANGLTNPNDIVVGTTLDIPGGAPAFQPFWVENFARAPLWSGTDSKAVQLGLATQFTPLEVMAPETQNRYLVRVWSTGGLAYVDTNIVGPAGAPKGA